MLHESDVEGALILQDRVQVLVDDEADVVDVSAPDGVHELPEVLGIGFDIQTRLSLQIWKDGSLNSFQLSDYLTFFLSTTFSLSPRQAIWLTRPDPRPQMEGTLRRVPVQQVEPYCTWLRPLSSTTLC